MYIIEKKNTKMSYIKKNCNFFTHNKHIKLVIVNIIVLCAVPFISCAIDVNGNSLDSSSEYRKQFILPSAEDKNYDEEFNSNEDQYYKSEEGMYLINIV